jgi:uncharacterized protein involved in exopolysaccharide biosynthesis
MAPTMNHVPKAAWRRPFGMALLAGVAAGALTALIPDTFRSEARILQDAGRGATYGTQGVWAPSAPPVVPGTREDGATVVYAEILKSRSLTEKVLQSEYSYEKRGWRFGSPVRVQGTLLGYLNAPDTDRAQGGFRRLLAVERNPKSGLLTLAAETHSPELSQQVVRRVLDELARVLVDLGQAEGRVRARSTQERLQEAAETYTKQLETFRRFQASSQNWETSPSPNLRLQGSQFREQVELWRRVCENLTLNREQALLEARNEAQTLLVLDPPGLPRGKCRPHRALLALGAMVLAGAGSWVSANPANVKNLFIAKEKS